jgi:DNA-binding CsgD family transcriptional regulator
VSAAAEVPEGCPLTPRQFQILQLLGDGAINKYIAGHVGISPSTVRSHVEQIRHALGAHNITQAVTEAGRRGWMGWTPPPQVEAPSPLVVEHPFLAAYLREFERSRWPNEPCARSVTGMRLALAGHRNTMEGA